jgi:D-apionolactonase
MSEGAVELRAGPVRLQLDGADLRGLQLGARPVVQRVYPAFRDADWRTAPIVVRHRRIDRGARSFVAVLEGTACLDELDLAWTARAEGREDGTVSYVLDAEARRPFASRRLGLCVHLDAAACTGARAVAGGGERGGERRLGELISPQPLDGESFTPMIGPFTRLALSLADGSEVTLGTAETRFELEDQRNWGDSSLKAYSSGPPQALHRARGDRVHQEVRLGFAAPRQDNGPLRGEQVVTVGSPTSRAMVPVGLALTNGWSPPEGLKPAHLRIEAGLADSTLAARPQLDALLARTGAPVELAVHGSPEDRPAVAAALDGLPLARVLALDRCEQSTSAELLRMVRRAVGRSCPMGVGTSAHFSEVCRRPPPMAEAEVVCWSAHPQVHASDDRSVMENLPGLGAQVRTARALLPELRPLVSVLRLGPAGSVDPRGSSAFGAAWAVGAFSQLLEAGVHAVTVAGESGQEAVTAVAAALMSVRYAPLRPVSGVGPGIAALAWGEREVAVLLANLGSTQRSVRLALPSAGTPMAAAIVPNGRRGRTWREVRTEDGEAELYLAPYESLRLVAPC